MEQVLNIASNITTLLLPVFLIGGIVVVCFIVVLLVRIYKIAGNIHEMTFWVNNFMHNSFFMVTNFISKLFEKQTK